MKRSLPTLALLCLLAASAAQARSIPDPHQKHAPGNEAPQTPIAEAGYSNATNYQLQCAGCHLSDGAGSKANDVPRMLGFVGNFLKVEGGRQFLVRVPGMSMSALNDAQLADMLNWLLRKDGLGATNHFESCGFIRSRAGIPYPDIQYHFLPMAVSYNGNSLASEHGFQAHVGPMRSKSRGHIRLKSRDVREAPLIRFNYMSHPEDWEKFRHCVRLTREIFGQKAFDDYRGAEIQPGANVQTDDEIDAFLREHLESAYHPCGTCRMGAKDDPMAVVDPDTRVIGVDGLRVADSSIFPHVTYGNLNGPSIMTGEKAADHILGKPRLARSNQEPWVNPRWETSDR